MRGDSIFVDLINNSIHFQKLFRKEMLNYSAINYGAVRKPSPFTQRAYTDTLQISMKTEKPVYPILTGSIVIEQWIEFGFEMVITVRFQYNANVVHQTVVM